MENTLMRFSARSIGALAALFFVGAWAGGAEAATLTVCPSSCNYTKIQDAINFSTAGDTILVKSTYNSQNAPAIVNGQAGNVEIFPVNTSKYSSQLPCTTGIVPGFVCYPDQAIHITGEVDGSGNPTTTIAVTDNATKAAFVMNAKGGSLKNLKFIPLSASVTGLQRIIGAGKGGTCPANGSSNCHIDGFTIDNVVIDFSTSMANVVCNTDPEVKCQNGIDLLAHNVTINKVNIKGLPGNHVFVDGNNYTITNNTFDGRLSGVTRAWMAIGFGADEVVDGTVCKGIPVGYSIQNNSITGFRNGIHWCTGDGAIVKNNTITNIARQPIETAGSKNSQITTNTIVLNDITATGTVNTADSFKDAIGVAGNAFQTCSGNKVSGNTVTVASGIAAPNGVSVQNCANTEVSSNTLTNVGGSIIAVAEGATTTITLNTINNSANAATTGIGVTGSTSTSCSNSTISSNSIAMAAGLALPRGIAVQQCATTTISSNTLLNISGSGIDVSNSKTTQIRENIQNNANSAGDVGIGATGTTGTACTGLTISDNKVLGRSARDFKKGIAVQNCSAANVTYNEVRQFGDVQGAAIFVSNTGLSAISQTVIDGNTLVGGNGSGLYYQGIDVGGTELDQSIIRGNVVNDFAKDGIIVQNVKGKGVGAGAGNEVAYNSVRDVNKSGGANAAAFNLQNLNKTAIDRNMALLTTGTAGSTGYGFFLAGGTNLVGNCNTGASNGGGLFGIVAGTSFSNGDVDCRVGQHTRYSFGGDSRSDPTFYRQSTGQWFSKTTDGTDLGAITFGSPTSEEIAVPGSYVTVGTTDRAVYRFNEGTWYVLRSDNGQTLTDDLGDPSLGDIPVPADFDGDGKTDFAVFSVSTPNAEWRIKQSSNGKNPDGADSSAAVIWGCAACGDIAIPADFDGDGKADLAVYRRITGHFFVRSSITGLPFEVSVDDVQHNRGIPFGNPAFGDLPVPGKYTQSTKAELAVYRSFSGDFFIRKAADKTTQQTPFGNPGLGDIPTPADFTTAGRTNIAIFRRPESKFRILSSSDFVTVTEVPFTGLEAKDAPMTSRVR
jgi:hypothetical protein